MKLMKRLFYIFPAKQRWQFAGLFFLQLIETFLDFFGVSLILPFVNVLVNADALHEAGWYVMVSRLIGSDKTASVLLFITLLMIAVYIVKNLFMLFVLSLRVRFVGTNKIKMGTKMITCYLHKPYTFHLQRNTSEIIRNINGDVTGAFNVINNIFVLISDVLIVLSLVAYLFAVDYAMTLGVMLALALCSAVYFLFVRNKIRELG